MDTLAIFSLLSGIASLILAIIVLVKFFALCRDVAAIKHSTDRPGVTKRDARLAVTLGADAVDEMYNAIVSDLIDRLETEDHLWRYVDNRNYPVLSPEMKGEKGINGQQPRQCADPEMQTYAREVYAPIFRYAHHIASILDRPLPAHLKDADTYYRWRSDHN